MDASQNADGSGERGSGRNVAERQVDEREGADGAVHNTFSHLPCSDNEDGRLQIPRRSMMRED